MSWPKVSAFGVCLATFGCLGPGGATGTGGQAGESAGACVTEADVCWVDFRFPMGSANRVELRGNFASDGWEKGVPLELDGGIWRTRISAAHGTRIVYKFLLDDSDWVLDPNNPEVETDANGTENSVVRAKCGEPCDPPPEGIEPVSGFDWRSAVMYFVFVDRFRNGDPSNDAPIPGVEEAANYQGGDFEGVRLAIEEGYFDELGVNTLWLTVPMDNPSALGAGADGHDYSAYHGYWPSDLQAVEEHFGTLDELRGVVDAAHARGMKVIFDYAMNHVHSDNLVFQEHPEWFWPLDFDGARCVCGEGCEWTGYEGRRCWFRDYLPDWNFQDPDARLASVENALFWANSTGIDGFRLDAVKHIETLWIEDLRARLDVEVDQTERHFFLVGETFETQDRDAIRQYVGPLMLDGQFDFPLRGALVNSLLGRRGDLRELESFVVSNDEFYPGTMSTFLGNHDVARVIETALDSPWEPWDNGGAANWNDPPGQPLTRAPYERLAIGFGFLFTSPGIPLIYYGDEVGLAGAGDPDNRRMMPDPEDLSLHQEWLKSQIVKLGAIRAARVELWKGTRTTRFVSDDVYAYRMRFGTQESTIAINRSDLPQTVENLPDVSLDLLSDDLVSGPSVTIPPRTIWILAEED